MTDERLTFTAHLEELRKRLIICIISIGVGFVACYSISEKIYVVLARPLQKVLPANSSLIFTTPTEAFLTYLKTALIAGFFLSVPIILFQVWKFIAPGLYKHEKACAIPFVLSSSILFVGGALFGYFMVFPIAFKFLMGISSDMIPALPSMKEYLSFTIKLLFAFGIFQVNACHGVSALQKMGVAIDKTRQNKSTLQVDDFRIIADEFIHLFRCAHSDNGIVQDGHSFGPRLIRINRPNFAVNQGKIGHDSPLLRSAAQESKYHQGEKKKINNRGACPPSPLPCEDVLFPESENRVPETFFDTINA